MKAEGQNQHRCHFCGRYVDEGEAYYARLWPYDDFAGIECYCGAGCVEKRRTKDASETRPMPLAANQ